MPKDKSIKDAVHGYVTVAEPYWRIIDMPVFQRLKWVEQTSYRPLFPSARHDRFVHSIGVFHLGQKAIQGLEKNAKQGDKSIIEKNKDSFLLACLLHDIGHAPFSHTSEKFFNFKSKTNDYESPLVKELFSCMSVKLDEELYNTFEDDCKQTIKKETPAEHEIMSSIVVCKMFEQFLAHFQEKQLDIDLIVRAIIGCSYRSRRTEENESDREKGIKNCLIRLLNSKSIDVDKLDYIARDNMMTGYDNMVIDTTRLLGGVTMVCDSHVFYPAFKKSALSVISNVFTAKSLQARWILKHPTIVYDSHILKISMIQSLESMAEKLNTDRDDFMRKVFSSEALLEEGISVGDIRISLFSDIDILYILKRHMDNPLVKEYFSRNQRRKPIWKSYEEYRFYLKFDVQREKKISEYLAPLCTYSSNSEWGEITVIDKTLKQHLIEKKDVEGMEDLLNVISALEEYNPQDFSYVILQTDTSFAPKVDPEKVYIKFGENETDFAKWKDLENFERTKEELKIPFFYLFSKEKVDPKDMLEYLEKKADECMTVNT